MPTREDSNDNRPNRLPGILSDPDSTHSGFSDASGSQPDTGAVPDESDAFALVGNEIRAKIIHSLGAFDAEHGTERVLSFSQLQEQTDVSVISSQFNYHLQKLVGHYIENVNGGYRLRPEGKTLYRTIRAGTFAKRDALPQRELDQDCYYCDEPLTLAYDNGMFTIQCHNCGVLYDLIMAPPAAIHTTERLESRVTRYNYHLRQAFAHGVCPSCVNSLGTTLLSPAETDFEDVVQRDLYVYRDCTYCGNHSYLSVGTMFLHHPAVIGFCYERGLDITSTPRWELAFAATDRHLEITATDPYELVLSIPVTDDTLELTIDQDLQITAHVVT